MQVKIFSGQPEAVERAINRWADDGGRRNVNMIVPMQPPGDGDVAIMIVFTPLAPATGAPKLAVPNGVIN